jgi:hypothetical protein
MHVYDLDVIVAVLRKMDEARVGAQISVRFTLASILLLSMV